jgi:hypothetical protein
MAPFAIRFGVDTPVALRSLLHFDGLLGALATAQGRDFDDISLNRFTVEGTSPFWMASAAILETGTFGALPRTMSRLKHLDDSMIDSDFLQTRKFSRIIDPMHRYRNQIEEYPIYDGINAVWFTGVGHRNGVLDLVQDCRSIGAMHDVGYGRVISVDIYGIDASDLIYPVGVRLASGAPARTIPMASWGRIFNGVPEGASISMQRAAPPYWVGQQEPCISPFQTSLMGTRSEVSRMLATT